MSEFEDYIKARYPVDYDSLKEKYPNVHVCEFYGDEQDLWDLKQAKIDDSENTRAVLYRENTDIREKNTDLQAKIDDLEKQLDMMKYINDEQSKNIQNAFKTIEIEQGFKDELQKRIDGALFEMQQLSLMLSKDIDGYEDPAQICQSEGVDMGVRILEKALRGAND